MGEKRSVEWKGVDTIYLVVNSALQMYVRYSCAYDADLIVRRYVPFSGDSKSTLVTNIFRNTSG